MNEIWAEFTRVPVTVHGVHLLILQAGTVTKEHRERPTQHCGLFFVLRGFAKIRIENTCYETCPGKVIHCAFGQKLEIHVGQEEFEALLIQYLPEKGAGQLSELRYISSHFEQEPGENEGLANLLRAMCLISKQPLLASSAKTKELLKRILKETFRLSQEQATPGTRRNERRQRANSAIDSLADVFNKTAFVVEEVIRSTMPYSDRKEGYLLPKSGFFFVVKGQATMSFDGRAYALEPGSICHGDEGACMSLTPRGGVNLEYHLIHYRFCQQPATLSEGIPGDFALRPGLQPRILELLERLDQTAVISGRLTGLRKKELFLSILNEVLTHCQAKMFSVRQLEAIEYAIQYIHTHYANPLALEELARMQGMSARPFSYLFHKYMGIRPIDYVIEYRINRAREMLAWSQETISTIAARVGYDDPQYFSRVFKRHTGLSPKEARSLPQV